MNAQLVKYAGTPRCVVHESDYFGVRAFDLAGLPRRLIGQSNPENPLIETGIDVRRAETLRTPAQMLSTDAPAKGWLSQSLEAQKRLGALFLYCEDPHRRLESRPAAALLHQLSLVQHILTNPNLTKVLIADEVGLGKTVEAGMLVSRLLQQDPRIRVLYLSPARLVSNVVKEFRDKLELDARSWSALNSDARLSEDRLVVASINKAVHPANHADVVNSGPWDVVIVDECHHLSDWGEGGGKPNRSYRLVRDLLAAQSPSCRLILMSGTPHQGHAARFRNILKLLERPGEQRQDVAGRVIFRTKEGVADWDGRPLFPKRIVRPTTIIPVGDIGDGFVAWYANIAALYDASLESDSARRAAGWAKGQSLQWAASSIQAGLGLLVRLGIRRLKLPATNPALRGALSVLRPYRGGSPYENIDALYERVVRQIGVQQTSDGEGEVDQEYFEDEQWAPNGAALENVLEEGVELLNTHSSVAKWECVLQLLEEAGKEKVVFFAQPLETVAVFASYLRDTLGVSPAVITGGQSDEERRNEILKFWRHDGPQFLVSSRAGGEGVNLQCARRLVHLDVPWNPMDLEQRTGRVHRFGSKKPVIVDTVVLGGTRESDAYRVARAKLALIVRELDPDKFEALFSRVMSLVPAEDFEAILCQGVGVGMPLVAEEEIGGLVRSGYERWKEFSEEFRGEQEKIAALNPGLATWHDLGAVMVQHAGAVAVSGVTGLRFDFLGEDIVATQNELPAFEYEEKMYVSDDTGGMPIEAPDGRFCLQAGTNEGEIARFLRGCLMADAPGGAAYLRLAPELRAVCGAVNEQIAVLGFVVQRIRWQRGLPEEVDASLKLFIGRLHQEPEEVVGDIKGRLVRGMLAAVRLKDPPVTPFLDKLVTWEEALRNSLHRPVGQEAEQDTRRAVWPVVCAVLV